MRPKTVEIVKQIRAEGLTAFYGGFFTNLMRITPNYAITFVLYEHLSYKFQQIYDNNFERKKHD